MSDIYVPGVKSRLGTDKLVEDLMKVERIPRDRAEKNVETLQTQKGYWQEIGTRINTLRESARSMYSFQNPFNDRVAKSSDESVLSGTATRQAVEQEHSFTVKQVAKADRFLSKPLETSFKVEAGDYSFRIGEDEIKLTFKGGSLKEFAEALNRRGRDKIKAGVLTVEPGTQSILIESLVTGAANRLNFGGASDALIKNIGMAERKSDSRQVIQEEALTVEAGKRTSVGLSPQAAALSAKPGMVLSIETSTRVIPEEAQEIPVPPQGPSIPQAGAVTYGGVTVQNDDSSVPIPPWNPPQTAEAPRINDMNMLSLKFTDGTTANLPMVKDSSAFTKNRYDLSQIAPGKTLAAIQITNNNTHRDLNLKNIEVFDPENSGGYDPSNAISKAQDAVIEMEGIEIRRPTNNIDDLLPGVTVIARAPSDYPVTLTVEPDRQSIKESIIAMVGNYNRLVAEINVLTRNDDRIVQELTYLSDDEQKSMKEKLGKFSAETSLSQFKNTLQRSMTSPYPTSAEREVSLLAQIGVGTDVRRAGSTTSYDASRMRGYMEIDEKVLDAALAGDLAPIQQLFGNDTDGDLIIDSGVAYSLDSLTKPYVETGGIITLKTGTIDSKIDQENRKMATLDRQLAAKEQTLKRQYSQMDSAFSRMEKMSTTLDNFTNQANAINNSNR
jgi:flagellar hook-associated protein 2